MRRMYAALITAALTTGAYAQDPGPLTLIDGRVSIDVAGAVGSCTGWMVVSDRGWRAVGHMACGGEEAGSVRIDDFDGDGNLRVYTAGTLAPQLEPQNVEEIQMSHGGETVYRSARTFHGACREAIGFPGDTANQPSVIIPGAGSYVIGVEVTYESPLTRGSGNVHARCEYTYYHGPTDDVRTLGADAWSVCSTMPVACDTVVPKPVPWAWSLVGEVHYTDITEAGFAVATYGYSGPYAVGDVSAEVGQPTLPPLWMTIAKD